MLEQAFIPEKTEAETTLSELQALERYPEKNAIDSAAFERLFRLLGAVTRKSRARLDSENKIERPLSFRYARARLYNLFRSTSDRNERKKILEEAHDRDELLRQFLQQGEVNVYTPDIGSAAAQFTVLNPPKKNESQHGAPIVLIPGISNDLACVDFVAQELAQSGRKTIVIGHPESYVGKADAKFSDAVQRSATFEPHARFFTEAIQKLTVDEPEIELWGISTGAPIIAEILAREPQLANRVQNAVLINPASSVAQSKRQLWTGLLKEMKENLRHPSNMAVQVLTHGKVGPKDQEQLAMRKNIMAALLQRICEPSPYWKQARVRPGGSIVVVSGKSDDVTHCRDYFNDKIMPLNPQMKVAMFDGNHAGPCVRPAEVIKLITEAQKS
ncbi:MAG TPA: hypothetical protein VI913_05590 [Candidatus Peribacteraceae bacterium]|nr:hypothetical protein [Candidatus Peribacteraceae bacterium]